MTFGAEREGAANKIPSHLV